MVKSKNKATLIQDLDETFANLRKINLKLNPEKCVFGVPSGKLLGFFVSQRGIEANPDKIKAIEQIEAPKRVKVVRRLAGAWLLSAGLSLGLLSAPCRFSKY